MGGSLEGSEREGSGPGAQTPTGTGQGMGGGDLAARDRGFREKQPQGMQRTGSLHGKELKRQFSMSEVTKENRHDRTAQPIGPDRPGDGADYMRDRDWGDQRERGRSHDRAHPRERERSRARGESGIEGGYPQPPTEGTDRDRVKDSRLDKGYETGDQFRDQQREPYHDRHMETERRLSDERRPEILPGGELGRDRPHDIAHKGDERTRERPSSRERYGSQENLRRRDDSRHR